MPDSRRSFLRHTLGTLAAGAAALPAAAQGPTRQELAAMDGVVSEFMQARAIPGMSIAVARNGELAYERGFGFADRDRAEKVTPAHLFRIASVSKPITSVAVFQLVEQGKLNLEDPEIGRAHV